MRLIIFILALTIGSAAHAATISVKPAANGEPALVTVDGDLQANDGDQFRSKTSFLSKAIVSFRSDGGSAVAGIQIGESIRLKGFTTIVAGNARCASACAIAWLGGTPRLMSAEARVGFHAAYSSETGQETGVGNALVGAYLNKIGLPYSAVIYITQAAPYSMTWLSIADAEKQGIDVQPLGSLFPLMPSHGQINQGAAAPSSPGGADTSGTQGGQSPPRQGGAMRAACSKDMQSLCPGLAGIDAAKCLIREHRAQLSTECITFFKEARAARRGLEQPGAGDK